MSRLHRGPRDLTPEASVGAAATTVEVPGTVEDLPRPRPADDEFGPSSVEEIFGPLGADSGDGSGDEGDGDTPAPTPRRRRRRTWIALGVVLSLLLVTLGGGAWWLRSFTQRLDHNIERFGDPFAALPADERPATEAGAAGAMNILMLGSDSRISAGDPTDWQPGAQRTDAIMIMHIDRGRSGATIMSIPRDSWVPIPGHGKAKINAAFSWGGPSLMVRTVEAYTHVRIDHVVMIDFDGFKNLTDALGGVTVTVAKATHDEAGSFPAGPQRMNGETALRYVRQRHNLPGGDFDREKRQQNWIRAIMREALAKRSLSDLSTMTDVLTIVSESIATDQEFGFGEMTDLVWSMRHLGDANVRFFTAPVAGTGWSPDHKQSIVNLDADANAGLWAAVAGDRLHAWMDANQPKVLGETVR